MNELVDKAFKVMIQNLDNPSATTLEIEESKTIETAINKFRISCVKTPKTVGEEGYNMKGGIAYSDVFTALERVGDHIINVTETLAGEGDIIE